MGKTLTFIERVEQDRLARLMTRAQHAAFLGVSEATVYSWIAGMAEPTPLSRAKVEQAMREPVKVMR